jgi:hypothetical protein
MWVSMYIKNCREKCTVALGSTGGQDNKRKRCEFVKEKWDWCPEMEFLDIILTQD